MMHVIGQRLSLLALWGLCQLAAILASLWMLIAIITGSRRAWTIAVAHDQLANAAFGGNVRVDLPPMRSRASSAVWSRR